MVIVLAVLAIIALIAIPNFNKVRTDSQVKADQRTIDVIKRVTTMAVADQDLKVLGEADVTLIITPGDNGVTVTGDTAATVQWKKDGATEVGRTNYQTALKEVKKPQEKKKTKYNVTINKNDVVTGIVTVE